MKPHDPLNDDPFALGRHAREQRLPLGDHLLGFEEERRRNVYTAILGATEGAKATLLPDMRGDTEMGGIFLPSIENKGIVHSVLRQRFDAEVVGVPDGEYIALRVHDADLAAIMGAIVEDRGHGKTLAAIDKVCMRALTADLNDPLKDIFFLNADGHAGENATAHLLRHLTDSVPGHIRRRSSQEQIEHVLDLAERQGMAGDLTGGVHSMMVPAKGLPGERAISPEGVYLGVMFNAPKGVYIVGYAFSDLRQ